jgi:hypothetical protein
MRITGFRALLVAQKLGRCVDCLRLAVRVSVAAWVCTAVGAFISPDLGWAIAVIAVVMTVVAAAHVAAWTARCGPRTALRVLLAAYKDLECGCDKVPVGYELRRYYATQQKCEEDIAAAYNAAKQQADDFCSKINYKCIDEDCPWLHWVNPTSTLNCNCEQVSDGRWQLVCDLIDKTQCCCSPEL